MPDWSASNKQLGGGIPFEMVSTFNDFGNLMQFGNCSVYSDCRRNLAIAYFKNTGAGGEETRNANQRHLLAFQLLENFTFLRGEFQ